MARKGTGILALLASPKKKSKSEDSDLESSDAPDLDAKEEAVKEFFRAGKSGDYAAAAEAFKDLYDLCAESHSSADDEEFDDEEY